LNSRLVSRPDAAPIGDPVIGVVRVELDGRLEAVAEAVDVGSVGVDVWLEGIRVLGDGDTDNNLLTCRLVLNMTDYQSV
jgi:hypothetical protein